MAAYRLASIAPVLALGFSLLTNSAVFAQDAAAPAQQPETPAQQLLVDEAFGDWRVVCSARTDAARVCSMLQQLVNQDGVRIMAIELKPAGSTLAGTLVMPFGLDLPSGVKLQVDKTAATNAMPFDTCLYDGCIVNFELGDVLTAAMRAGNQMMVLARSNDDQDLTLAVSLRGASAAADRVTALAAAP